MDHIEYVRFSICTIAQSFTRVQGFVVPRVFGIHVISRKKIQENKKFQE